MSESSTAAADAAVRSGVRIGVRVGVADGDGKSAPLGNDGCDAEWLSKESHEAELWSVERGAAAAAASATTESAGSACDSRFTRRGEKGADSGLLPREKRAPPALPKPPPLMDRLPAPPPLLA